MVKYVPSGRQRLTTGFEPGEQKNPDKNPSSW